MEDRGWIERARAGDPKAFSRLVERYQRPVFNLCYRMLHNPQDADDAAQEAFLKAYRGFKKYDDGRPFLNWLLSIAAHHCIDRLRRKRFSFVSLEALGGRASGAEGPEHRLERRQQSRRLQAALMQLGATDRATLVLRYWNELSYAEIAQSLGLTESAVKSRLHRAKRQLAATYQTYQDQGGNPRDARIGRRVANRAG